MTRKKTNFRWQTTSGETTTHDDIKVTPRSRALSLRSAHGGWVWNCPVAVLVERDGQEHRVPIVDVTRVAQLILYGFSLVFVLSGLYTMIRKRRD